MGLEKIISDLKLIRPPAFNDPKSNWQRGLLSLGMLFATCMTLLILLIIFMEERQPVVGSARVDSYADFLELLDEPGQSVDCACEFNDDRVSDVLIGSSDIEGLGMFPIGLVTRMLNRSSAMLYNRELEPLPWGLGSISDYPLTPIEQAMLDSTYDSVDALMNEVTSQGGEIALSAMVKAGNQMIMGMLYVVTQDFLAGNLPSSLLTPNEFSTYIRGDMLKRVDAGLTNGRDLASTMADHDIYYYISDYGSASAMMDIAVQNNLVNASQAALYADYRNKSALPPDMTSFGFATVDDLFNELSMSYNPSNVNPFNPRAPTSSYAPLWTRYDESSAFTSTVLKLISDMGFYGLKPIVASHADAIAASMTAELEHDIEYNTKVQNRIFASCDVKVCQTSKLETEMDVVLKVIAYYSPAMALWVAVFRFLYEKYILGPLKEDESGDSEGTELEENTPTSPKTNNFMHDGENKERPGMNKSEFLSALSLVQEVADSQIRASRVFNDMRVQIKLLTRKIADLERNAHSMSPSPSLGAATLHDNVPITDKYRKSSTPRSDPALMPVDEKADVKVEGKVETLPSLQTAGRRKLPSLTIHKNSLPSLTSVAKSPNRSLPALSPSVRSFSAKRKQKDMDFTIRSPSASSYRSPSPPPHSMTTDEQPIMIEANHATTQNFETVPIDSEHIFSSGDTTKTPMMSMYVDMSESDNDVGAIETPDNA